MEQNFCSKYELASNSLQKPYEIALASFCSNTCRASELKWLSPATWGYIYCSRLFFQQVPVLSIFVFVLFMCFSILNVCTIRELKMRPRLHITFSRVFFWSTNLQYKYKEAQNAIEKKCSKGKFLGCNTKCQLILDRFFGIYNFKKPTTMK